MPAFTEPLEPRPSRRCPRSFRPTPETCAVPHTCSDYARHVDALHSRGGNASPLPTAFVSGPRPQTDRAEWKWMWVPFAIAAAVLLYLQPF